ncbi:hypothetical protein [Oceanobacillus damuensis]|uniref:hypothetical protein n=1 Tax=Oceanobacillus damuensis TaxID=937928 RepID=UPI00082CBC7E|nr:hypothetical protein [Oceanobacillus damuensis]
MNFLSIIVEFFYNNFILLLLSLFIIAVILMLFIKKGTALIISACIVVVLGIAATFIIDQLKYTTFQEAFSEQLDRDTVLRQIVISTHNSSNQYPERVASVTIEDEEIMEAIINDFMGLELKKDTDSNSYEWDYTISITKNNQIKEGYSVTRSLTSNVNDSHINDYEVIDNKNHLKTVGSIVEDKEFEWDIEE